MQLIILPGMDGTGLLFKPLLECLVNELEITIITYPGDQELSYQELTALVRQQLPQNRDYVLVAESFSGPIAYEIAKDDSEHLKAIIFVASFISPPNKLLALAKFKFISFLIPKQMPAFFLRFLLGKRANQRLYSLFNEALQKVDTRVLFNRLKEMANLSLSPAPISQDCFYIQADNDHLVSPIHARQIHHLALKFQQYQLEGSHFILQVNPHQCAVIIQKVIESQFITIDHKL